MGSDPLTGYAAEKPRMAQSPYRRPPLCIRFTPGLKRRISSVIDEEDVAPLGVQYAALTHARRQHVSDQLIGERQRTRPMIVRCTPCEDPRHKLPVEDSPFREAASGRSASLDREIPVATIPLEIGLLWP